MERKQELGKGSHVLVVWSSFWKVFDSFRMYLFLLPHTEGCSSIRDQKEKGLHSPERCLAGNSHRGNTQLLDKPLWSKGQRISLSSSWIGLHGVHRCSFGPSPAPQPWNFLHGTKAKQVTSGDFFTKS